MYFIRKFLLAALFVLTLPLLANASAGSEDFDAWLVEFRREAAAAGISAATLDRALAGLQPVQRILERDRNQAEFKWTFEKYVERVASEKRIADGQAMYRRHAALLRQVAERHGVQPRFIVAIWGLETNYGQIKPTMPVVPALATLAYDVRRSSFFRRELIDALRIVDAGHIELENMTGSWAGAMGQPQFIPSSYLAYAVDFDGDGRRDIWRSEADVFGSIANYLASHGWSDDTTWGREVRLPPGFQKKLAELGRTGKSGCRAIDQMSRALGLNEWQALGVRRADGRDLPTRNLPASLAQPDGPGGRSFLVYSNYHSILRYNCAHLYALTVGILADGISGR